MRHLFVFILIKLLIKFRGRNIIFFKKEAVGFIIG